MKITLNTSFEVRNRWFQLLCRHRRHRRYATRENATPLYLSRPRNERAPHYRYICTRSVILVRPSPASYTTYRDRTRYFYCAISCWPSLAGQTFRGGEGTSGDCSRLSVCTRNFISRDVTHIVTRKVCRNKSTRVRCIARVHVLEAQAQSADLMSHD